MTLFTWSQTAADNDDADTSVNVREGWAPSIINNSIRALMAAIAKWRDDMSGNLVTAGTSTAYTLTTNQVFTALTDGLSVTCRMSATNGATPTLNVDGRGAKSIATVYGTAVPTGALLSGGVYSFTYDSTDDKWIVQGRFGDGYNATNTPDLAAIEAISTTGVLRRSGSNTWAADADVTHLADTTANRLFGTDGSGNSGLVTASAGLAIASSALALDINALTADTNPDPDNDYMTTYDASASAAKKALLAYSPGALIAVLEERQTQGVSADGLSTGAWSTSTLNTESYDRLGIVSLSSDEFTISAAGVYEIEWNAPYYGSGKFKSRLYDVTGAAVLEYGTQGGWTGGTGAADFNSTGITRVSISGSNTFKLQYYASSGSGGISYSVSGAPEIYTRVVIRRG